MSSIKHPPIYNYLNECFGEHAPKKPGKPFNQCCNWFSNQSFWVCDYNTKQKTCVAVSKKEKKKLNGCFEINNPNKKQIYVVCIDDCLIQSTQEGVKIGDHILFDDTVFCYLESKMNLKSGKTLAATLAHAEQQIKTVLTLIQNKLSEYGYGFRSLTKKVIVMIPSKNKINLPAATLREIKVSWTRSLGVREVDIVQGVIDF